jgi:hypothetical protein
VVLTAFAQATSVSWAMVTAAVVLAAAAPLCVPARRQNRRSTVDTMQATAGHQRARQEPTHQHARDEVRSI